MEKIVVSKTTQRREFFKANGHLSVMNDRVKESWFSAYWTDALRELSCHFPEHFIEIIEDDIDINYGECFYLDFDKNEIVKEQINWLNDIVETRRTNREIKKKI